MSVKKYIVLFLILLVFKVSAYSQYDSIINANKKLYNEAVDDSTKMEALYVLSVYTDNADSSLNYALKGLSYAESRGDTTAMAVLNQIVASNYTFLSNHIEALRYDLEALRLFRLVNREDQYSSALNNIGEDYLNLDLHNEAYRYYQQSLKSSRAENRRVDEAIALYNIGRVLIAKKQYKMARRNIQASMALSEEVGDRIGIAYSNHDLARIDIAEGHIQKALEKLKEAYTVSIDEEDMQFKPQILLTMAQAYEEAGDYQEALEHYADALEIDTELNNKEGIANALFGKGHVAMKMGNYDNARTYLGRSLSLAQDIQDNSRIIKCYQALSELYEKEKKYDYSLNFYKKYKQYEDSLFSERKQEQFAQMQIMYETAQKDLEIQLLNEKEQQQVTAIQNQEFIRNILVVILAFTAVLLFTLHKNNVKRRKVNELLIEQRAEIEAKSKELEGLLEVKDKFFSIISHDLRSPINALIGIMDIMDGGNLTQAELKELSIALNARLKNTKKLLDTLLDWAMLQMDVIKLNKAEINLHDAVSRNLHFYEETAAKDVRYVNRVPDDLSVKADTNMLDLILRNLLSNASKFTEMAGEIVVGAEKGPKKTIIISVADDGIGMSEEQIENLFNEEQIYSTPGTHNEKGTGLGLKLCKEFVEKMGGNIWVESLEGKGSIFKFTVPKA